MTHELKTWPEFFAAIESGVKPFEMRQNDRGFRVGDTLLLNEYETGRGYTGRSATRRVSFILEGPQWGIQVGYVCLGLADHVDGEIVEPRRGSGLKNSTVKF